MESEERISMTSSCKGDRSFFNACHEDVNAHRNVSELHS